jgi:hypothetical protein
VADSPATGDSPQDRIAKLLPGDVTAAFLSSKAALVTVAGEDAGVYVFWTFIAILVLCPFYFYYVTQAKTRFHVTFLTLSFVVFAISIAATEFIAYFNKIFEPHDFEAPITAIAIVLPILWTYLVTQISVVALKASGENLDPQPVQP